MNGVVLFGALQAMTLFLFALAAAEFASLVKGCYVLRRLIRARTRDDSAALLKSPLAPVVSVLATPADASPASRSFVRRLVGLHYGDHEVVLVLDGPSPAELAAWTEEFRLVPSNRPPQLRQSPALPAAPTRAIYESRDPLRLLVIEKERGGEADAWNSGVNHSRGAVIAIFDPGSEFAPDGLLRLMRPMLDSRQTAAVCGIAPAASGEGWASRFFAIESLRQWLARGAALADWQMLPPVPGSAVLIRREAILQAGGFPAGPLELVLRLHGLARAVRKQYGVSLVPAPVSRLLPPQSLRELGKAVAREQRQIARAFANRRSYPRRSCAIGWGMFGLLTVRLIRPGVETVLYLLLIAGLILRKTPPEMAALVFLATPGSGILLSMAAVVLRELALYRGADPDTRRRLFLAAIPENLGYRQVRNLWLIAGFFSE